jgi:hypothetical protein
LNEHGFIAFSFLDNVYSPLGANRAVSNQWKQLFGIIYRHHLVSSLSLLAARLRTRRILDRFPLSVTATRHSTLYSDPDHKASRTLYLGSHNLRRAQRRRVRSA